LFGNTQQGAYLCPMTLQHFKQLYPGSSFPTLVENTAGEPWILKMRGAGNGPLSLLSEFIANRVAAQLGWPVPDVNWIRIPDNYPWIFGTDEFDDIVQKSYGWNLGIQYIPDSQQIVSSDIESISEDFLNILYTLDLFFMNVDRTAKACNLLRDGMGRFWIIDHGFLMLFQPVTKLGTTLFSTHIFHILFPGRLFQYDRRLHDAALFEAAIRQIPEQILADSGWTQSRLIETVLLRMTQL